MNPITSCNLKTNTARVYIVGSPLSPSAKQVSYECTGYDHLGPTDPTPPQIKTKTKRKKNLIVLSVGQK